MKIKPELGLLEKNLREDSIVKCSKKLWVFPTELLEEFLMEILAELPMELLEELSIELLDEFLKILLEYIMKEILKDWLKELLWKLLNKSEGTLEEFFVGAPNKFLEYFSKEFLDESHR